MVKCEKRKGGSNSVFFGAMQSACGGGLAAGQLSSPTEPNRISVPGRLGERDFAKGMSETRMEGTTVGSL